MAGVRGGHTEELFQTRALTLWTCGRFSIADEQLKMGTTLLTIELKQRHVDSSGRVVNKISHWRRQPNADQVRCLPRVDREEWNVEAQYFRQAYRIGLVWSPVPTPKNPKTILSDWLALTNQR